MTTPEPWMDRLHEFTRQVPTDYQLLAMHYFAAGLPPEACQPAVIQPLPASHQARYCYDAAPQACYYNALTYCLRQPQQDAVRYVLGYYVNKKLGFPLEHAFVKVGDRYYDPTCQFVDGMGLDNYADFAILELTVPEALACMDACGHDVNMPPTLFEAINWQHLKEK